jgi:hypothetical protein
LKKKTQEQFLEDCKRVHGDKYDYSLAEYKGAFVDVIIGCRLHGSFKQRPDAHINGKKGCTKCGKVSSGEKQKKYIPPKIAIHNLTEVHDNRYEYLIDSNITQKSYIYVVCGLHGVFRQRYDHHINGSGCKRCLYDRLSNQFSFDKNDFIKSAQEVHGNNYDYSSVEYTNSQSKVKIICLKHGIFEQQANSHLRGCGCPSCGEYGYDPDKKGSFYILDVGGKFLKFGITNNFRRRFKEISNGASFHIEAKHVFNFDDGNIPREIERLVRDSVTDLSVLSKEQMLTGYTETTSNDNLELMLKLVNSFTNNTS